MHWIKITTTDNKTHYLNVETIMDVYYIQDTNLTVVNTNRSAYPSFYVRGNIMKEFQRYLLVCKATVSEFNGE